MTLPELLLTLRALVRDTFRQALASGIFWLMLLISLICALFCLSVQVSGDVPLRSSAQDHPEFLPRNEMAWAAAAAADTVPCGLSWTHGGFRLPLVVVSPEFRRVEAASRHQVPIVRGELTLAFGAVHLELTRGREEAVHFIQLNLATWAAGTIGLLLTLLWTGGFLPAFVEPSAASVLLAKPVPRWALLAGKYLGVLVFVTFQMMVFVGGTWLALGLRTGVWNTTYIACVPLLVLHFAIFFSVSALLAVTLRNAVACVFGSIAFWVLCSGMNFARHAVVVTPEFERMPRSFRVLTETIYWVLPKPTDLGILQLQALQGQRYAGDYLSLLKLETLLAKGAFDPELSVLSSLLFTLVVLVLAAYAFAKRDY